MTARAFITGLSGVAISADERRFLREAQPWGLIVFARNVDTPEQVRRLVADFRDAVGRHAPVLVDQEGGRVQRLGPPHWPVYPPGSAYGRLYGRDRNDGLRAAWLGARLMAADLAALGIDVDCLPLADMPVRGADPIIGDRAYGDTPEAVTAIARSVADGLRDGGVLPVLKHIPGHGRPTVDSHLALPVVDTDRKVLERTDFVPFKALADLPLAMTAHVVFSAIDAVAPATTSVTVVGDVIRGWIGFGGLLMSDDISMSALSGSIGQRAAAAIAAGCDVILHCNGKSREMDEVAAAVPLLSGQAAARVDAALASRTAPKPFDHEAAVAEFASLLRGVSVQSGVAT